MMLTAHSLVTVKPAGLADAVALAEVFRLTWRSTYAAMLPHSHIENKIKRRGVAWWRSIIRSCDTLSVIKFDGRVVGYATCGRSRNSTRHKGEIYELYILPQYQGVGLGELLFEACRHNLDEQCLRGLIVWCLADNVQAIEFYERRGGAAVASCIERIGGENIRKIAFCWDD